MEKIFNLYRNILFVIAIIMIGILILPMIVGIRPFVVLSGSMEPVIHTGSLCYINQKVESADIVTGDVIAFNVDDETVVHRVIGFDDNGNFITKGDANDVQDIAPVPIDNFAGKQVFTIPYMGYVSQWLQSKVGIVFVVAAIALSFLSSFIYGKDDGSEDSEEDESDGSKGNESEDSKEDESECSKEDKSAPIIKGEEV